MENFYSSGMDKTLNALNASVQHQYVRRISRIPKPVDAADIVDGEEQDSRDLIKLLIKMRYGTFRSQQNDWILDECKRLFRIDYICKYMDNLDDNIPGIHPNVVIIPVAENDPSGQVKEMNYDVVEYLNQEQDSGYNNVARFPCPVILFNGKYVCRSRYPPIIRARRDEPMEVESGCEEPQRAQSNLLKIARIMGEIKKESFARKDADFLHSIDVKYLCDLTNSTECDFKDDIANSCRLRNIYERIEIIAMPYPGRENFADSLNLEGIQEITKKYLKNFLQGLIEGKGGFLVQSFKGCHRSALFTSLLRLSLWADGVIHKNLKMTEIAFLTLGYDWYLFGYRIIENQDSFKEMISFFFNFLPEISGIEFSITRMFEEQTQLNQASTVLPTFQASRRAALIKELSTILLKSFHKSAEYFELFNKS